MSNVQLGYTHVIDPISFKSIPSGKIYIGEYGTLPNPANAGTWKQAYFVNSDGTRTAASQPITTNAAGYAVDGSGNIKPVQVDGQYSILVQSSLGVTKFSSEKAVDSVNRVDLIDGTGSSLVGFKHLFSGSLLTDLLSRGKNFVYATDAVVDGDNSFPAGNLAVLQEAIDYATTNKLPFIFNLVNDCHIDNTLFIDENALIYVTGSGGLVRTTTTVDAYGNKCVLSLVPSAAFKKNVRIYGKLKLQFSAGLNANTSGSGTIAFNADNLYESHVEIRSMYSEFAWSGKSNFNITGLLDSEWCHKGLFLDPSVANSAGGTCTSFDMRVNMDFTIHPFVLKNVVYSKFSGFVEAIRTSYPHYAANEMSVVYNLNNCQTVCFEMGIEAFQGMMLWANTAPSYVKFTDNVSLTDADHFAQDGARISNVPLAQQALISIQQVGTYDFDQTVISGGSVTVSTGGSYLIRRSSDSSVMTINGGFIEPGTNYTFSDRTANMFGNGNRFYTPYRYTATESRINLGNGLVWIDVTGLVTNSSGEVVVAPTGIKQLLMVDANVVRSIHATGNVCNIKSKDSAVQWTMITGLAAGFSVDVKVLAISSS